MTAMDHKESRQALSISSATLAKWLRHKGIVECLATYSYFIAKEKSVEEFVFIKEDSSEVIVEVNGIGYGFTGCIENLRKLAPGKQPDFSVYCTIEDACREMCKAFADNRAIELYDVCAAPNLLDIGNLTEEMAKIEIDMAIRRGDRHGK